MSYTQTESGLYVQDGLQNVVSGLGTGNDKRSFNRFNYGANLFDFAALEAAYQESWIARKVVQIPVDDALREWRGWTHQDAADIEAEERRLDVVNAYRHARYWARLYGGAAILMITDQPLDKPLDVDRLQDGGLKRLVVLDRWEITPQRVNYTDPTMENYLLPEIYVVRGGTQEIHSSHVVRVDGEDLPRRLRALNQTWGDSTVRKILDDLEDVHATQGAIASLVQEANVDVIKRAGLTGDLASGEEGSILERYALNNRMKSAVNGMLLDSDSEEYERKGAEFSGLGEILDKLYIWVSGSADIPMTRLFGQSAAGMDATGEGDLNNYYDSVAAAQSTKMGPELEKLDAVMVRSAGVQSPEDADYNWNPLYQESGTELAQQELARAQSEDIRLQQGAIQVHHVAERARQEGAYPIDEDWVEYLKRQDKEEMTGGFGAEPDPATPVGDEEPTFEPPKSVRKAAQRGLDLRDKWERGGTRTGIARGRDLSNGRPVTADTIRRMTSFFARHEDNRTPDEEEDDGGPTNGWIAWLLWGGDPGRDWANRIADELDEEEDED